MLSRPKNTIPVCVWKKKKKKNCSLVCYVSDSLVHIGPLIPSHSLLPSELGYRSELRDFTKCIVEESSVIVTPYVIRMWYIYVGALHTCLDGSVVVTCFGSSRVPVFSCESRMPAYRSCTVLVTQWQVLRLPLHYIRFSMYKFIVPQEYLTVLCL